MKTTAAKLQPYIRWIIRYKALLFFVGLSIVYGYVIIRINTLNNITPDPKAVSSGLQATSASIDPAVVQKIQQLQDNSVNVKSLFDQARQSPFQE